MKIRVLTDSGANITQLEAQKLDIDILPLQVLVDDQGYDDGLNLDTQTLYDLLKEGKWASTSQPKPGFADQLFASYQAYGITDVIGIFLSPSLSGTAQMIMMQAQLHGVTLHLVDMGCTASLQGYYVKKAKELLDKGASIATILGAIQTSANRARTFLVPDDLQALARGGRLSPGAAKFANMLKIKPICECSLYTGGKVDVVDKVRTLKKAIKKAVELFDFKDEPLAIFVIHSDQEEGRALAYTLLHERFPNTVIEQGWIPAVIACHTGLGALGIQICPAVV